MIQNKGLICTCDLQLYYCQNLSEDDYFMLSGVTHELLTPCWHAVALLEVTEFTEPGVLQNDGASLQSVLPHRVLTFVPDLERPLVSFHNLVHVNVGELISNQYMKQVQVTSCSRRAVNIIISG